VLFSALASPDLELRFNTVFVSGPYSFPQDVIVETEVWCSLLVILVLIDSKQAEKAAALTTAVVARMDAFNRRSLDVLSARIFYYYSWAHELVRPLAFFRMPYHIKEKVIFFSWA